MRSIFLFFLILVMPVVAFSQVGINTETPKATFEVMASATDSTKIDGIIAPKLTGDQLQAKDDLYNFEQTGAIVYVTDAVTTPGSPKTANVTSVGYYYFDGMVWQKITDDKDPIWKKEGSDKIVLNFPNSSDSIYYSKNGYREFDKTSTIINTEGTSSLDVKDYINRSYRASFTDAKNIPGDGLIKSLNVTKLSEDAPNSNSLFGNYNLIYVDRLRTQQIGNIRPLSGIGYNYGSQDIMFVLGGVTGAALHFGSGSVNIVDGLKGEAHARGTGTVTNLRAVDAFTGVYNSQTALVSNSEVLYGDIRVSGNANITNLVGVRLSHTISGYSGTITNAYDFYAPAYSVNGGGLITNKYGVYIGGSDKRNYFQGKVGIGQNAGSPLAPLHVIKYASDITPVIIEGCPVFNDNTAAAAGAVPVGGYIGPQQAC